MNTHLSELDGMSMAEEEGGDDEADVMFEMLSDVPEEDHVDNSIDNDDDGAQDNGDDDSDEAEGQADFLAGWQNAKEAANQRKA